LLFIFSVPRTGKIELTCHTVCFSICAFTTSLAAARQSALHSTVTESCCIL